MLKLFLCFIPPLLAIAQDYRGNVKPVIATRRSSEIEFFEFRMKTLKLGHEGPDYFAIKTQPVAGREYLAEAHVSAIDAVSNIRFELVDDAGRAVQTLVMWKETDAADDGDFAGLLAVPAHPFRAVATITDRTGRTMRLICPRQFRPAANGPEEPVLPPGMEVQYADAMRRIVDESRQAINARMEQARQAHPGGWITLSRARVLSMSYEPLLSPAGNEIGLRLRYAFQPETDLLIAAIPHVFPAYTALDWRGTVSMKPLNGAVNPVPEIEGVASVSDLILYNARARYRAGITYAFTVDLIPDYVIQGVLTGGFCLYEQKFIGPARTHWEGIRASTAPVKYSISITALDYAAEIPSFFPQRTFYEGLVREGARDCGAQPTNRFCRAGSGRLRLV